MYQPAVTSKKKVLLVRHGETFQNFQQQVQGQHLQWGRLTPAGFEQADLLADRLCGEPIDAVYCSPLERAVLTMAAVLQKREGERTLPLFFPQELREINQGTMQGQSHQLWKEQMGDANPMQWSAADAENWLEVKQRVAAYFNQVILGSHYQNILVVAHGGVNRGILADVLGISMQQAWARTDQGGCPQQNTCINTLTFEENGTLQTAVVNDSSHLLSNFSLASEGQRWLQKEKCFELLGADGGSQEFTPYG